MEDFGGRKFSFAVAVALIGTGCLFFKVISPDNWIDLIKWLGASYFLSNAISKIGSGRV